MSGDNGKRNVMGLSQGRLVTFMGLVETILDQDARTKRAGVQGRTLTALAVVLIEARARGTVAVSDSDGTEWTMTVTPATRSRRPTR